MRAHNRGTGTGPDPDRNLTGNETGTRRRTVPVMHAAWNQYETDFAARSSTLAARRQARRWQDRELALAGITSPEAMVIWAHGTRAQKTDAAFLALVRLAVGGDQLAGETLLRCLHPGLRRLARRFSGGPHDPDVVHELVGMCWERIVTYPVERRPRMVAVNILWDVRQRWTRRHLHRSVECETTAEQIPDPVEPDGTDRMLDGLDAARQAAELLSQLRPRYAEVLARTRLANQDPAEAAAEMGMSRRSVIVAGARAIQRCRQLAA